MYKDSKVDINKFVIKDKSELAKAEWIYVNKKLAELEYSPIIEEFSLVTFYAINEHLFGMYPWAGKPRAFDNLENIENEVRDIICEMKSTPWEKYNLDNENDLNTVSFKISKTIAQLYKKNLCEKRNFFTSAAFVGKYLECQDILMDRRHIIRNFLDFKNNILYLASNLNNLDQMNNYEFKNDVVKDSLKKGLIILKKEALEENKTSNNSLNGYKKLITAEKYKSQSNINKEMNYSVEEYFASDKIRITKDKDWIFEPIEGLKYDRFEDLCKVHEKIFSNYEWAGKIRTKDLKIPELFLNGRSIEYKSPKDIKQSVMNQIGLLNNRDFNSYDLDEKVYKLSIFLSSMYKLQPYKGTMLATLSFLKNHLENKGIGFDVNYLCDNINEFRTALADASAYYKNGDNLCIKAPLYEMIEKSIAPQGEQKKVNKFGFRVNSPYYNEIKKSDAKARDARKDNKGHNNRKMIIEI